MCSLRRELQQTSCFLRRKETKMRKGYFLSRIFICTLNNIRHQIVKHPMVTYLQHHELSYSKSRWIRKTWKSLFKPIIFQMLQTGNTSNGKRNFNVWFISFTFLHNVYEKEYKKYVLIVPQHSGSHRDCVLVFFFLFGWSACDESPLPFDILCLLHRETRDGLMHGN